MCYRKRLLCVAAVLVGTFAQAQEVVLPDDLIVGWIDADDAFSQAATCLPKMTIEKWAAIREGAVKGTVVSSPEQSDKSSYLIASGDRFACIRRNGAGMPVLPARIFGKMVRIEGAAESSVEALYRDMAIQLASRGSAEALIKFPNGNAFDLTVSAVEAAPFEILYTSHFLKAGEFDEHKYRYVVTDNNVSSLSTMSYGARGRNAVGILQDELAPRPLRGEYLRIAGNEETGAFRFEGATWAFRDNGSIITFQPGGVLAFKPKSGNESTGLWTVENGVLYFNYGKVFGSASLNKEGNLAVEFRTPNSVSTKKERRWTTVLERPGLF